MMLNEREYHFHATILAENNGASYVVYSQGSSFVIEGSKDNGWIVHRAYDAQSILYECKDLGACFLWTLS